MFNKSESEDGVSYQNNRLLVFFGKKNCDIQRIQTLFPHLEFRSVKQKHSDKFIQSFQDSSNTEADAHWTNEKNVALLIKTADCLPIMAYENSTSKIAAIHAGWRGVACRISALTLKSFNRFDLFVGPHILQKSFEVKNDVQILLNQCVPDLDPATFTKHENGQINIDLQQIVLHQIGKTRISHLCCLNIDTKTGPEYHSYRRDQQGSGRNLSFICLLT